MEILTVVKLFFSIALVGFAAVFLRLYNALVAEPGRLRSKLRKQGVSGPPRSFWLGNIGEINKARTTTPKEPINSDENFVPPTTHDCASALFPFFEKWRKLYGQVFMFSLGNKQILHVNRPDMVREIATCTSLDLGRPSYQVKERGALLGQGILTSNGTIWAFQRKILAPELNMEKVKGMMNLITESAHTMVVDSWKSRIESGGGIADIKIDEDMRRFSGDVISRACFGSNFSKGEEIFKRLRALKEAAYKKVWSSEMSFMRHIPTKDNRETWALEKDVRTMILQLVKERTQAGYEKDLLQMVLEGARNNDLSQDAIDRFIVDNCKNIYLAGYEATAISASWSLMLLAANPEWQERVRAEVVKVCNGQIPDSDMVRKMKQLTMVINESLRLYSDPVVSREALVDMKFGNIQVPKGVNLWILMMSLHTDPEIWGPDALKFKPDRFADGITGACKLPHLYMPFGVGPRMCPGQHLAMVELKVLIALIVSNFSFSLSPKYVHSPALKLVIEPGHGVNLLVKKL